MVTRRMAQRPFSPISNNTCSSDIHLTSVESLFTIGTDADMNINTRIVRAPRYVILSRSVRRALNAPAIHPQSFRYQPGGDLPIQIVVADRTKFTPAEGPGSPGRTLGAFNQYSQSHFLLPICRKKLVVLRIGLVHRLEHFLRVRLRDRSIMGGHPVGVIKRRRKGSDNRTGCDEWRRVGIRRPQTCVTVRTLLTKLRYSSVPCLRIASLVPT